jgi:oxalate decarboxylase/phosphoglucose isomerase-like protein (cupin superfamily)
LKIRGYVTNIERDTLVIPAGVKHIAVNTSDDAPLRLYTLYNPAEHPDGTVQHKKADEAAAKSAAMQTRTPDSPWIHGCSAIAASGR